jgi:hypothetical protein
MQTYILPKYSKVIYRFNSETKHFVQSEIEVQETPINRIPMELRLAPVGASQIRPNADKMLLSRLVNGKYSFRTGLQETDFETWYLGNDFEYYRGSKVISIILVQFVNDTQMELYYFHRYDKNNTFYRRQFANNAIIQLIKRAA